MHIIYMGYGDDGDVGTLRQGGRGTTKPSSHYYSFNLVYPLVLVLVLKCVCVCVCLCYSLASSLHANARTHLLFAKPNKPYAMPTFMLTKKLPLLDSPLPNLPTTVSTTFYVPTPIPTSTSNQYSLLSN